MKMTRSTLMIAALTAAFGAGSALAQSTGVPAQGPMTFAAFDRNGDGSVSEQEFNTARAERLAARAATGAPMRGAANAPAFRDFDLNGDGRMTADEFNQVRQSRQQGRPGLGLGMGPGYGGGMGRGMGPGMGRGRGMNMPAFSDFDLDGNGVLTEQEFYQARAKRIAERSQQGYPMRNLANAPVFGAIDRDGNGQVDPTEFAAAQAEHRRQMMTPASPSATTP